MAGAAATSDEGVVLYWSGGKDCSRSWRPTSTSTCISSRSRPGWCSWPTPR